MGMAVQPLTSGGWPPTPFIAKIRFASGSRIRAATVRTSSASYWRKVKTTAWREANRKRWQLFERVAR